MRYFYFIYQYTLKDNRGEGHGSILGEFKEFPSQTKLTSIAKDNDERINSITIINWKEFNGFSEYYNFSQ